MIITRIFPNIKRNLNQFASDKMFVFEQVKVARLCTKCNAGRVQLNARVLLMSRL